MNKINGNITTLIASQVNNINKHKEEIIKGLHELLNGHYLKYDIENSIYHNNTINLSNDSFQSVLFKINEKTNKQKQNGVYYTPNDVAKYIIYNSFITNSIINNEKTFNIEEGFKLLNSLSKKEIDELLYNKSVIDVTCGTGEFLVNTWEIKYSLATAKSNINDEKIIKITSTIFGNDIDDESIDITKIRLFFNIANKLKNKGSFIKLAQTLNNQFYNIDFISNDKEINNKYDIIIGNPPYVEYRKYTNKAKLKNNFGNVYADVIKNSIDILKENGVLGYIVPLSYTSTTRMTKIRNYVIENTKKQFILNFADRPDCLFTGVHQKLNILIAEKGKEQHKMYTSNYKHWYKDERHNLLNGREVIRCIPYSTQFIPKIGNTIEESIFRKVHTTTPNNIFAIQNEKGNSLFLNMRACFWIKAFSFNPGSKEYKIFNYTNKHYSFMLCLLNSSLFWVYWTMVSDCWHITIKELKGFLIPLEVENNHVFIKLATKLEHKLEKTKKYIGTKQVDYEYKHRLCKDVIDEIDDELAKIYNITNEELNYIKSFALKYRTGGNNDD